MNSQQRQSADYAQEPGKKRKWFSQRKLLIFTVLLVAGVIAIIWILSTLSIIPNTWYPISYLVVTIIGAVLSSFESLHLFASSHQNEPGTHSEHLLSSYDISAHHDVSVLNPRILPIIIPLPITQSLITQSSQPNKTAYRDITSLPPLTDPRTIEQREADVIEKYDKVTQPGTTAMVLTGIAGVGKSTLAALVYHYAEEQRYAGNGIFTTQALWLNIDPAATMADLAGTMLEKLNKTISDFSNLNPLRQAAALFEALNTSDEVLLVILDQFENLLKWDSGHALADRAGIGEWLDAINNQACKCRLLFTSRVWPQGSHAYPPTYMQESQVHGLETYEGVELLRKQGIGVKQATETELGEVVERCDGHALALVLLASILSHNRSLSLYTLLYNPMYSRLWIGDVASNLLDFIYMKQMSEVQRKLLLAFSVYREPVPLEAALTLIDFSGQVSKMQILEALQVLLAQHLLQATGEERYQLHPLITFYAESHFDENSEQTNLQVLKATHARAALYYQHQVALSCPPRNMRQHSSDIRPLIESIWQYCNIVRLNSGKKPTILCIRREFLPI